MRARIQASRSSAEQAAAVAAIQAQLASGQQAAQNAAQAQHGLTRRRRERGGIVPRRIHGRRVGPGDLPNGVMVRAARRSSRAVQNDESDHEEELIPPWPWIDAAAVIDHGPHLVAHHGDALEIDTNWPSSSDSDEEAAPDWAAP